MTTNRVLELINGSLSILSLELMAICILYCWWQSRMLKMRPRDWLVLPIGMALALSMAVRDSGDFTRYITIWWWRFWAKGTVSLGEAQLMLLIVGGSIAAVGMLLMIYVLTREWFAWRVLALCAGIVGAYLVTSITLSV